MEQQEKKLTEKESLDLIATMITKAKDSYHNTGTSAMMWGTVVAICALVRLAELQFNFKLPFDIYLLTMAAIIPQVIISIREKRKRKVKSYDETYMDYIWLSFGICIFLMIHVVNLMFYAWEPATEEYSQLTGKTGFRLYEYIHSFFLILYGLPTFITGAACKFRPMLWGGLFCWACSAAAVYTPFKADLLLTALSAVAAWFIPGLIMEKEYRAYKKQQGTMDV